MGPSTGLMNQLNALRSISSQIYNQYVPVVTPTTNINDFAAPILNDSLAVVRNEFVENLIGRIVSTQVVSKMYNNPLRRLEGENTPLGYAGQEIYTNPVEAQRFDVNDFCGLLHKFEVQTNVQYLAINMDLQYCASMTRDKLRNAFVSWAALEQYITSISDAMYNGARIDQYRYTTAIVSTAYKSGRGVVEVVNNPTSSAQYAKDFVKRARQLYLDFQSPSTNYTAWGRMNNDKPIVTWTNPEDIVFILRNDVAAEIDVEILAEAFNIDRATLLGNIYYVDNFNIYADDRSTIVYDGSKIYGIMADRNWFKIHTQDEAFDQFFNAKARTWSYFLNIVKGYNMSLFAKHVIFASEQPDIPTESLTYEKKAVSVTVGNNVSNLVGVTPTVANSDITYSSSDSTVATVAADSSNPRNVVVTGVAAGTATITATSNNKTATFTVTVSEVPVTSMTFADATKTVAKDATVSNTLTVNPSDYTTTITYSSSDSTVATVEAGTAAGSCVVTGVAAGSATITATAGEVTATFTVTVTEE